VEGGIKGVMEEIFIKDIMTPNPIALDVEDNFSRVEEFLRTYNIRHLPIIDKDGIVVGLITQRDLYRICPPRRTLEGDLIYEKIRLDSFILKYVMTKDVLTLSPNDTLGKAIRIMKATKYGCLPIVDENKKLVGIVTQIGLLRAVASFYK